MKVHRSKHTEHFTITPNAIIRDERMGELARLILIRLLSNADDYQGATALKMWEDARTARGDKAPGKRAYLAAFSELEEFGYLVRTKVREGSKWVTRVDVYDTPQEQGESEDDQVVGVPGFGKPDGGMPDGGNPEGGQSSRSTSEKDASRRTISSSSVPEPEPEPAAAAEAPAAKTTKTPEQIVQERTDATEDEARAVVDHIETQGDSKGARIRSLAWWITNREDRDLTRDLAHVRRHSAAPTATECGKHRLSLASGSCRSCDGDIKAGDLVEVTAELQREGSVRRSDLARALGAPEAPGGDRPGMRGGTRAPIPDHEFWNSIPQDQDFLRDMVFGSG